MRNTVSAYACMCNGNKTEIGVPLRANIWGDEKITMKRDRETTKILRRRDQNFFFTRYFMTLDPGMVTRGQKRPEAT